MDIEKNPPAEASVDASRPSAGRRKVLKAAIAVIPVVATVRSRPAWAGYASLQAGYGTSSAKTTGG